MAEMVVKLARQVVAGTPLSRTQAEQLVRTGTGMGELLDLFRGATMIREHFCGHEVKCCSIVAAKAGRCSEDCTFCSQSARYQTHVAGLTVLPNDNVFDAAMESASNGASSFGIVNSGLGPTDREIEHWGQTVQRIRATGRVRTCTSLGILKEGQACRLAELGVQCYNHNLQTSRRHFPNIITTHGYDDRLATLRHLKSANISICSGALFGMGEGWADRLDLAFELREFNPDVVPINFLVAIDGTPLEGSKPLSPAECLKTIAVYRYLLPRAQIKIAGGREVHLRDLQSWIFLAGANGIIIGNYLTTFGRSPELDRQMIRDAGLDIGESEEKGDDSMVHLPADESASVVAHVR